MATQPVVRTKLNLGVNLRGLTGGINCLPGQAQDTVDVLPREDGAIFKHWGWIRRNATALNGRVVGVKSFAYRGKNSGAGNVREGNYAIADDGAQFSRRQAIYTGVIVLTTTTFYFWRPDTEVFEIQALPAGVALEIDPKPTFVVANNNVYIFGYATHNLRYDPTDRALYVIGWDNLPTALVGANVVLAAGGTLISNAVYQYATAWWDLYTGEVGPMGTVLARTPVAPNLTVQFNAGAFTDYAGTRHFQGAGTDDDVGLVLYRTEPDGGAFHFLATIPPQLVAAAFTDNGLATAKSEKAERGVVADMPKLNAAVLYKDMIFGLAWEANHTRVYFNTFKGTNSFYERWRPVDYSSLPMQAGEVLTALAYTEQSLLTLSQQRGFLGTVNVSSAGRVNPRWVPLPWVVGAIGPKAICTAGPWVYWISERGPQRWREGLSEPQWIGRDLLALFIDPTSGLCKLNEQSKYQSECAYDRDAGVVRFILPVGRATFPNLHLMYWIHDDIPGLDPAAGWFFSSQQAQAFDYGNALARLNATGTPVGPFERRARMLWGDALGYVNEYEIGHMRGGLLPTVVSRGTAQAGSTVNVLVTMGGLYTLGDDMAGMRLEVVYTNNSTDPTDWTYDIRQIAANTATDITPDYPFTRDPTGALWYVAGIPSFWRSVPEHLGDPYPSKDVVNVGVKLVAMRPGQNAADLDLSLQAGDYSVTYRKTEGVDLAVFHDKTMGNASGRFVAIEVANTRPDEMFAVTSYALWVGPAGVREKDG